MILRSVKSELENFDNCPLIDRTCYFSKLKYDGVNANGRKIFALDLFWNIVRYIDATNVEVIEYRTRKTIDDEVFPLPAMGYFVIDGKEFPAEIDETYGIRIKIYFPHAHKWVPYIHNVGDRKGGKNRIDY